MKILIVSDSFPISTTEVVSSFILDEALRIARQVEEAHAVRLGLGADLSVEGVRVHNVKLSSLSRFRLLSVFEFPPPLFLRPMYLGALCLYKEEVAKLAPKIGVDVLHAHFAYPAGLVASSVARSLKIPLVVTLHGDDILKDPSVGYGIRLSVHFDRSVRRVLDVSDRVLVASKAVYEEALKSGCDQSKLILLPMAVDVSRFNPQVEGASVRRRFGIEDRLVVFTVRPHAPKYGISDLLYSIPHVLEEMPETFFVVGGDGPLRGYHESLARSLGVSRSVAFTGRIPQSDLARYYAACDVFVIPSIVEAFGLVSLEAMACGKPVVGTCVGGILDVVVDNVTGLLARPRDPEDLSRKIVQILSDESLRRSMGARGRERVEREFYIERRIDRVIKIYSELCS